MDKVRIVLPLVMAFVFAGSPALADKPSVAMGKTLFNNPGLGASQNAISCGTCHANGEGMEKAGANPRLGEMINMCIQGPLKGEALSKKSVAMESLQLYLRSLAQ